MVRILKAFAVLFGVSLAGGFLGVILDYLIVPPETDPYGARVILYFTCGTSVGAFCSLPFLARMARRTRMSKSKAQNVGSQVS